ADECGPGDAAEGHYLADVGPALDRGRERVEHYREAFCGRRHRAADHHGDVFENGLGNAFRSSSEARTASVTWVEPPRTSSACSTRAARGAKITAATVHAAITKQRRRTKNFAGSVIMTRRPQRAPASLSCRPRTGRSGAGAYCISKRGSSALEPTHHQAP